MERMSVELRPCGLQGWAVCEGNCDECATTATATTDGYWYHGSGKLGGEFHPNKPNDEERYGEYVKIVRCKECKYRYGDKDEPYCSRINPYSGMRVEDEDFCSWGEKNG